MLYRDIAKELIILLGLALFIAFSVNSFSPTGIALFGEWDTAKGVISARPKKDFVFRELEINDVRLAKEIFDKDEAVFVDARSQDHFEEGHIKGAVSLPVGYYEKHMDTFKQRYPNSTYIITYCSGRECGDSHRLAQLLLAEGYSHISVFIDGYPVWKEAGYPIE